MSIRSTNRQRYPVPLQHVVELWRRITPQGTAPDRRKSNPSNRAQFRSRVHVLYSLAWGRQLGNTCTYLTTRASPVDIITHSLTHSTTLTPYNGRFPRKWRQPRQRAPRSSATIPQRDRICEAARRSRARREIARETAHPSIHPSTFHTHKQRNRTTNTDMEDGFRHTTATAIWCSGM